MKKIKANSISALFKHLQMNIQQLIKYHIPLNNRSRINCTVLALWYKKKILIQQNSFVISLTFYQEAFILMEDFNTSVKFITKIEIIILVV